MMKFYTLPEIREMTGISRNTLGMYCREGKLVAVKRGRKWLVSEKAFKDFFLPKHTEGNLKS